jgi:hypothetical protein
LIVKGAKSEKRVEEQKDLHKILNKKTVT